MDISKNTTTTRAPCGAKNGCSRGQQLGQGTIKFSFLFEGFPEVALSLVREQKAIGKQEEQVLQSHSPSSTLFCRMTQNIRHIRIFS